MTDFVAALTKVDLFGMSRLHDICVEIENKEYTDEQVVEIANSLPIFLQLEALQWGMDTCVSDAVFIHIKKNGAPHVAPRDA